jgi:hypothetical protein
MGQGILLLWSFLWKSYKIVGLHLKGKDSTQLTDTSTLFETSQCKRNITFLLATFIASIVNYGRILDVWLKTRSGQTTRGSTWLKSTSSSIRSAGKKSTKRQKEIWPLKLGTSGHALILHQAKMTRVQHRISPRVTWKKSEQFSPHPSPISDLWYSL